MADQVKTYVSARSVLPEGSWPADLLAGVGGEGLLDAIAYDGGEALGSAGQWALEARLRVMSETVSDVPGVPGLALVLGYIALNGYARSLPVRRQASP